MRKCYVVIGEYTDDEMYLKWVACVCSSYKKADEKAKWLKEINPQDDYKIQTEILI